METPILRTAFISGPIDASDEYFSVHYIPAITKALSSGDSFVMGPVPGIDTIALSYLLSPSISCPPSKITVYMAAFEYADHSRRNHYLSLGVNVKEVTTAGQGTTTRMRDEAMTEGSAYDILRYRTEEEAKEYYGEGWWPRVSNTEVNERRRRGDWRVEYRGGSGGVKDGVAERDTKKIKRDGDVEKKSVMGKVRKYLADRKG